MTLGETLSVSTDGRLGKIDFPTGFHNNGSHCIFPFQRVLHVSYTHVHFIDEFSKPVGSNIGLRETVIEKL
jgi:hypothetical protein